MASKPPASPAKRYRLALLAAALAMPLLFAGLTGWHDFRRLSQEAERQAALIQDLLSARAEGHIPDPQQWVRRLEGAGLVFSLDRPLLERPGWVQRSQDLSARDGRPLGRLYTAIDLRAIAGNAALAAVLGGGLGAFLYFMGLGLPNRRLQALSRRLKAMKDELGATRKERDRYRLRARQSGVAIQHLAYSDLLTDLPNRIRLMEELEQFVDDSQFGRDSLTAVIAMDLDNFKEINDTLGHTRGDQVLREVGERLRQCIKGSDLVGRLGGDEFGVILFDLPSRNEVLEVANRIIDAIAQPITIEGIQFDLQVSLGIALFPEHSDSARELFQFADTAMYQAKENRSGLAIYDTAIHTEQSERLALKTELRQAIDAGALQVYYQPKIDLARGHIVGVESLVRWIHPQRGFIGPDKFVPLAERSNLIHPMTGLVFNIALHQCGEWVKAGRHIGVAINCSAHSLTDEHLPERIDALLYTWGVPHHLLTVEVTESAIMAHPEQALAILTRLHEMGVKISVDDYGTGYSSLSYLKSMPVSELKIDRSFVSDMLTDENDAVIVRATIDMAHDLGLEVTAEGIEDEATWNALVEMACDRAQGYYMGKPMPADELERWMAESPFGCPRRPEAEAQRA